jgi:diphosphomevalonate decarboxylase
MSTVTRSVSATHSAPSNIAVIKYWGKRDSKLNLPINSSVSCTLNQDDLQAKTTVIASPDFEKDRLWLNGIEEDVNANKRVQAVLREVRARAADRSDDSGSPVTGAELAKWNVHIISVNNFPTAAGLASSAAGYACLVDTLADVFGLKGPASSTTTEALTAIARQGSGSACRSIYGGFVRWEMGKKDDGSDSVAIQVADEKHWPELAILIAVVSDRKKETGSTEGMQTSVDTSALLAHRASHVVPKRLSDIEAAYKARDFETFARITMQDSNQFHATCLDTYPPIFYMNDTSRRLIALVHAFNAQKGRIAAGYTFDAGPNCVVYTRKGEDLEDLAAMMLAHFPDPSTVAKEALPAGYTPYLPSEQYVSDPALESAAKAKIAAGLPAKLTPAPGAAAANVVSFE